MVVQEEKDTKIKVRSPAECLLLARSNPIMEESITTVRRRNSTANKLISLVITRFCLLKFIKDSAMCPTLLSYSAFYQNLFNNHIVFTLRTAPQPLL